MFVRRLCIVVVLLLLSSPLWAFEAVGTIKKVDAENRVVVIDAGGRERTVKVDADAKVLDEAGKELADGLKSKELKEGVVATFTVEPVGGQPTIRAIQLGARRAKPGAKRPGGPPAGPFVPREKTGMKPLTEMSADDRYVGEDGGLYGGGKNDPPAALKAAAEKETARIVPLDAAGKPAKDGRIVLVSISMSNATQEFSTFKRIADADPRKSPLLTIVDCAQGGQAMAEWAPPDARPWEEALRRLKAAGVTPEQVQIAWIKLANKGPRGELKQHGKQLQSDTQAVLQNAKKRFPNLRIAYLGSRIYGGYATGGLNPEPQAYEGAFVVRWLIQDQLKGNPDLNYDAARGAVRAPLLLWGPYFWADGTTPRKSDKLVWLREDLGGDGVHPSESGRQKVANMLLDFFTTDPLAKRWFVKAEGSR